MGNRPVSSVKSYSSTVRKSSPSKTQKRSPVKDAASAASNYNISKFIRSSSRSPRSASRSASRSSSRSPSRSPRSASTKKRSPSTSFNNNNWQNGNWNGAKPSRILLAAQLRNKKTRKEQIETVLKVYQHKRKQLTLTELKGILAIYDIHLTTEELKQLIK